MSRLFIETIAEILFESRLSSLLTLFEKTGNWLVFEDGRFIVERMPETVKPRTSIHQYTD